VVRTNHRNGVVSGKETGQLDAVHVDEVDPAVPHQVGNSPSYLSVVVCIVGVYPIPENRAEVVPDIAESAPVLGNLIDLGLAKPAKSPGRDGLGIGCGPGAPP
jgi:hypothetical protein